MTQYCNATYGNSILKHVGILSQSAFLLMAIGCLIYLENHYFTVNFLPALMTIPEALLTRCPMRLNVGASDVLTI